MKENIKALKEELEKFASENVVNIVRQQTQKHLIDIVKATQPKQILEIGTAIGYSGILMLANCNAHLTTIELIEKRFTQAKKNFEKANLSSRVTQIFDDAINALQNLPENYYNLIFLDGPKAQYAKYLPYLKKLLKTNGILFADDVLYRGMVLTNEYPKHKERRIVLGLRDFLNDILNDKNFETTLNKIEDGFTISKKVN